MTFMLLLGAAAGLYLIWLMFRLAAYATPLFAAMTLAFELLGRGIGPGLAFAAGFAAGLLLLLAGRHIYATARSPLLRISVGILFILPAGVAGFYAMQGFLELFEPGQAWQAVLSASGALVAATAALQTLGRGSNLGGGDEAGEADGPRPLAQ